MKKRVLLILSLLSIFLLVGCFNTKKEFSGIGMTITLNNNFVEKDIIQAPFYIESKDNMFMGMRESKSELSYYGVNTLKEYINAVLSNHQKTADVKKYEKDDLIYYYAYYTASVEDQTFGYMLFVMETETHFYSMNFASLEKNFESHKPQFKKWIATIVFD